MHLSDLAIELKLIGPISVSIIFFISCITINVDPKAVFTAAKYNIEILKVNINGYGLKTIVC